MIPANGLTPIILQGEIRNGDNGQVFEGFLRFDKIEQPQIAVTASMDDAEIGEMPARVVDLEKADSTEVAELGQEIGTELYPVLLQIVASLPKDYMQPVIQMMMQTD